MKFQLLIGVAALSLSAVAVAQDAPTAPPPPPPATNDMGAAQMPQSGQTPPPADPNAGMPTGQVPPDTGMVPANPATPPDPSAPVGSSANPVEVGGNATPPPPTPKDYPVCSKTVQDSCVNPGEAKHKSKARHRK
jgi:hypothetical protein